MSLWQRGWTPGAAVEGSGRCRTADALLPLLVTEDASVAAQALAQLVNPKALGSEFGLCGVHRGEPVFDPAAYWRGPVWPQLAYLLTLAASRFDALVAQRLQVATRRGAQCSGLAEYWHPDSGQGLGLSRNHGRGFRYLRPFSVCSASASSWLIMSATVS